MTVGAVAGAWAYYLTAGMMCVSYFLTVLSEPGRVAGNNRDELVMVPFKCEVGEEVREAREQTAIALSPVMGGQQQ